MNFENSFQLNDNNFEEREALEKNRLGELQQSGIEADKKLDLALLILERKEVVLLGNARVIESEQQKEQFIQEFQEEFSEIEDILKKMNLPYIATPPHEDQQTVYIFSFLVSGNKEGLKKAVEAQEKKDEKAFGLLLGYPETAVDAYNTDEALDLEKGLSREESDELDREGIRPFIGFSPSRKHWREELNHVKEDQLFIKEKAPLLYKELVLENNEDKGI